MRPQYYLLTILFFVFIFISGCSQKNITPIAQAMTCQGLADNFDAKINSTSALGCNEWAENSTPILVGARLIDISRTYTPDFKRYEFTLIFQSNHTVGAIYIGTKNDTIPYQIGNFYKFDLGNKCKLIYSAASSGMFSDPNLNALQHMKECD